MRDGRALLLSTTNRLHVQGNFSVAGNPLAGTPDRVWAACGSRLVDPKYIADNGFADLGRKTCSRCFPT